MFTLRFTVFESKLYSRIFPHSKYKTMARFTSIARQQWRPANTFLTKETIKVETQREKYVSNK